MTINDFQSYLGVAITIIGFLYVFAKFKAEFDLHKKILNELLIRVERIDIRQQTISEEFNLMKGFIFGKQS
jgi:hypothetical protein